MVAAFLWAAPTVFGANGRLTQRILPTDCVLTTVATGNGPQVVGECPSDEPQVIEVDNTVSGQRIIRGTFDADRTVMLRVLFRGVTYTVNTANSPLRVFGDSWTLAIDEINPEVAGGEYAITVEAEIIDGRVLTTTTAVTLSAVGQSEPDSGFEPTIPEAPINQEQPFIKQTLVPALPLIDQHLLPAIPLQFGTFLFILDDGTGLYISPSHALSDFVRFMFAWIIVALAILVRKLWQHRP